MPMQSSTMTHMKTRSNKFALSEEQIHAFHHTGWVCLENLFSKEELRPLIKSFENLAETAKEIKETQTYNKAHFVLNQRDGKTIINRICWAGGAEKPLLDCSEDPRLLVPVSQLLDSTEMDQLLCQAHFKMPKDGVSFDWHQDVQHRDKGKGSWQDLNGKGSYIQTILLLDDMTEENGPLQFLPNSSQWGRVYDAGYDYDTPLSKDHTVENIDYSQAVTLTGKAGTVVLFGPYTIHGSGANNSNQSRRVLINGYAYPGSNTRNYPGEGSGRRIQVKF